MTSTDISKSLAPLRDVVHSLSQAKKGHVPSGKRRRWVLSRVKAAGMAAVPALTRGICSDNETEAQWAAYLLSRQRSPQLLPRLHRILSEIGVTDDAKSRVLGILADLRAPLPKRVVLKDPENMLNCSVGELVDSLGTRREVSEAVDTILEQVPTQEIIPFLNEVLSYGGDQALPLLGALLADHRVPGAITKDLQLLFHRARKERGSRGRGRSALNRALNLIHTGKPQRARRLLDALVVAYPDDAEVRSAFGVCLLELGMPQAALQHLQRSVELAPKCALHRWNLAAAARAAEQMGLCYNTLHEYTQLADSNEGAVERQESARAFCRAYEVMLQEAYPGISLPRILQGEELFIVAYAALAASRYDEATRRFREVIQLVPRHYPSWGNLGAAYLAMDRTQEAVRCLRRALELNPDYAIARDNLALIEQR